MWFFIRAQCELALWAVLGMSLHKLLPTPPRYYLGYSLLESHGRGTYPYPIPLPSSLRRQPVYRLHQIAHDAVSTGTWPNTYKTMEIMFWCVASLAFGLGIAAFVIVAVAGVCSSILLLRDQLEKVRQNPTRFAYQICRRLALLAMLPYMSYHLLVVSKPYFSDIHLLVLDHGLRSFGLVTASAIRTLVPTIHRFMGCLGEVVSFIDDFHVPLLSSFVLVLGICLPLLIEKTKETDTEANSKPHNPHQTSNSNSNSICYHFMLATLRSRIKSLTGENTRHYEQFRVLQETSRKQSVYHRVSCMVLRGRIQSLLGRIVSLNARITSLCDAQESLELSRAKSFRDAEEASKALTMQKNDLEQLDANNHSLASKLDLCTKQNNKLETEGRFLEERIKGMGAELEQAKQEGQTAIDYQRRLQKSLEESREQKLKAEAHCSTLVQNLSAATEKITELSQLLLDSEKETKPNEVGDTIAFEQVQSLPRYNLSLTGSQDKENLPDTGASHAADRTPELEAEVSKLRRQLERSQQAHKVRNDKVVQKDTECEELKEQLATIRNSTNAETSKESVLREENNRILSQLQSLNKEHEKTNTELQKAKKDCQSAKDAHQLTSKEFTALETKLASADACADDLAEELEQTKNQLAEIQQQKIIAASGFASEKCQYEAALGYFRSEIEKLRGNTRESSQADQGAQEQLTELRKDLEQKQNEVEELRGQATELAKQLESSHESCEKMMQDKKESEDLIDVVMSLSDDYKERWERSIVRDVDREAEISRLRDEIGWLSLRLGHRGIQERSAGDDDHLFENPTGTVIFRVSPG